MEEGRPVVTGYVSQVDVEISGDLSDCFGQTARGY